MERLIVSAESKISSVAENDFHGKSRRGVYIMSDEKKCLKCGGTNLVSSDLQSTGKLYARPKHAKLSAIFTTGVLVNGNVCFDCGHVGLHVDVDKIKSALRES